MSTTRSPAVAAWERRGQYRQLAGHRIFTMEAGPTGPEQAEPLVVVHGFPSSSYDFRHVLDRLAVHRRVVLLDQLGFGLSDKPDTRYSIALQADVVAALVDALGLQRLALLTHDMGDTVGGELLARQLEGSWPVEVTRRVLANGSIYIEMAHLTVGQQHLLSLPDALADRELPPEAFQIGLASTMSEESQRAREDLAGEAELVCAADGSRVLARTIRYIEDRWRDQERFTGAIVTHPSPLGVVWGMDDPVSVPAMVDHLLAARPGTPVRRLVGVGHYPMLEAPERFAVAVEELLLLPAVDQEPRR